MLQPFISTKIAKLGNNDGGSIHYWDSKTTLLQKIKVVKNGATHVILWTSALSQMHHWFFPPSHEGITKIHLHLLLRWPSLEVINDAESARLLLEAGAQLEALDDTGRTPLALAAAYGNLEAQMMNWWRFSISKWEKVFWTKCVFVGKKWQFSTSTLWKCLKEGWKRIFFDLTVCRHNLRYPKYAAFLEECPPKKCECWMLNIPTFLEVL